MSLMSSVSDHWSQRHLGAGGYGKAAPFLRPCCETDYDLSLGMMAPALVCKCTAGLLVCTRRPWWWSPDLVVTDAIVVTPLNVPSTDDYAAPPVRLLAQARGAVVRFAFDVNRPGEALRHRPPEKHCNEFVKRQSTRVDGPLVRKRCRRLAGG
jgi:hypothetical protein